MPNSETVRGFIHDATAVNLSDNLPASRKILKPEEACTIFNSAITTELESRKEDTHEPPDELLISLKKELIEHVSNEARSSLIEALKNQDDTPPEDADSYARFGKEAGPEMIVNYRRPISDSTVFFIEALLCPEQPKIEMVSSIKKSLSDCHQVPGLNTVLSIGLMQNGQYTDVYKPGAVIAGAKFIKAMCSTPPNSSPGLSSRPK